MKLFFDINHHRPAGIKIIKIFICRTRSEIEIQLTEAFWNINLKLAWFGPYQQRNNHETYINVISAVVGSQHIV